MTRRVLVVDADPELTHLLTDILNHGGYRPLTATSADEALATLRRDRPAAVLVDLGLPCQEGWRFLENCYADPDCRRVPSAAMSPDLDDIRRAHSLGASDRLMKPFGVSAVLHVVDSLTCQGRSSSVGRKPGVRRTGCADSNA